MEAAVDPAPFLRARAAGVDLAGSASALLRTLSEPQRAALERSAKESRGLWSPLLAGRPRRALLVGDALSGATLPLAAAGAALTLADVSTDRLQLARALLEARGGPPPAAVRIADGAPLPFADGAFDLVVCERTPDDARLDELARVCGGELLVVAEHGPAPFARRPSRGGGRSLPRWRAALRARGFDAPRAWALHPGGDDPAQLLGLGPGGPRPLGGPRERGARLRRLAQRVGALPAMTRDLVLAGARRDAVAPGSRIERALAQVAAARGEPAPRLEHLVGSCGNTCEAFTGAVRGRPGLRAHLAMCREHVPGIERNHRFLELLRERHPDLPLAEPLECGEREGLFFSCERRLPGWAGDQVLAGPATAARMSAEAAGHLARLATGPARALEAAEFDALVTPWFERALADLPEGASRAALAAGRESARAALIGRSFPRVVVHGDLRAKHVQCTADGRVVGFIHWGVALEEGLPGLDLFHLLVHARRQLGGQRDGEAWRALSEPAALHASERAALDAYAAALELDPEVLPAVLRVYPAFVHAVAYSFTLFVRPGWFDEAFQLGGRP